MGKIVVFDSGLGSLSVINAIREATLSNMTYFADQRYFPYGVRSVADLRKIITERITMLEEKFRPEMIIVGSNTPTLLLGKLPGKNTLGVLPPLAKAASATKTGGVAVLATHSVWRSGSLLKYIRDSDVEKNGIVVNRIDCSELVNLVESGEFATSRRVGVFDPTIIISGLNFSSSIVIRSVMILRKSATDLTPYGKYL